MNRSSAALAISILLLVVVPFTPVMGRDGGQMEVLDISKESTITEGADLIGTAGLTTLGYTGDGVSVAILDTGIRARHEDLKHGLFTTSCLIVENESFVPLVDQDDRDGHGTFIAGILIGNGELSSGENVGMAPGTSIWNLKVLDDAGEGEVEWIIGAIDWIMAQPAKPDVVSMSFGATPIVPEMEEKVREMWESGIVVVAAAGNEGPEYYTMNSPANVLDVISVGSCSIDKYLMSFSSQGPNPYDYYYKPDLVALGEDVTSLSIPNGYGSGYGTSFSVPFIVGGISLLIEATGHTKSPDEIKAAVLSSCTPLGYDYFMDGAGLPDFTKALETLQDSEWNGFFAMPSDVEFPIYAREGTESDLRERSIKLTVINSKYDGTVNVNLDSELDGKITFALEEYEGGKDQFVLSIEILPGTFSDFSGKITFTDGSENVLWEVSVAFEGGLSYVIPMIIILCLIAAMIGVVAFFIVAYRKGVNSLPESRCEIGGNCTIT